MSALGMAHFVTAWIALTAGLGALTLRKGTKPHKITGYIFVVAMSIVNIAALCLYNINGHFNLFHALAIINLFAVLWAMWPFVWRRPGFAARHGRRMPGAYVGLCAAAANEMLTRVVFHWMPLSRQQFWILSVAITAAVSLGGLLFAHRQRVRNLPMFAKT